MSAISTAGPVPDVVSLLARRAAGESDHYRLAVTVEGGGLRGVVSGAMLIALADLGLAKYVDTFFGTSSGSINISYFAAGATWDALSVYYDHMTDGFITKSAYSRVFPRVDMEHLRRIMQEKVPLNLSALSKSAVDVRAVLADVDTGKPTLVEMRSVADSAIDYLLASSWLPIVAGTPLLLDGHRYLDGGVLWPNPVYAPLDLGYTHVLALNTRTVDSVRPTQSGVTTKTLGLVLDRWSPGLGSAYRHARAEWDRDRQILARADEVTFKGARVRRIAPAAGSHAVQRLTIDEGKLLQGARAGYSAVVSTFIHHGDPHYFSVTR